MLKVAIPDVSDSAILCLLDGLARRGATIRLYEGINRGEIYSTYGTLGFWRDGSMLQVEVIEDSTFLPNFMIKKWIEEAVSMAKTEAEL